MPPVEIDVRCSERKCGYVGRLVIPGNFFLILGQEFDHCPHCSYFTLTQYEPERRDDVQKVPAGSARKDGRYLPDT